jgi:cytochrome c-type biogenesis protein
LLFISGFSTIFIVWVPQLSYIRQLLAMYQQWIMKVGGVLIIILGINFTESDYAPIPSDGKRFELRKKPLGYLGSFFVGIIFAAGGRLVSGVLSTILIYASTAKSFLCQGSSFSPSIPWGWDSHSSSLLWPLIRSCRLLRKSNDIEVITIVSSLFLIAIEFSC